MTTAADELAPVLERIDGVSQTADSRQPFEPQSSDQHSVEAQLFDQRRADAMFARIAWSRITEPGDGTAGALIAVLGAERALELLAQGPSAERLMEIAAEAGMGLTRRAARTALDGWLPRLNRKESAGDIERAAALGLRVVLPGDRLWPPGLADLGLHAPKLLWVRGDPQALTGLSLGVVGARAATGYGSHITAEIVDGVCAAGITVVSGAAYGIDAVAHRTALAAGVPTVAVVAGGVDRVYPAQHGSLLERISAAGAVCAEMVPGTAPTRWRFLQRNRLIAAMSRAVLVTEAGIRSGSLNTAGHASQLGRAIGAVPGPVTSAASAGCHKLIREYDATLVTNAREVCELMGITDELALFSGVRAESEGAWERRVCDALPLRGAREASAVAVEAGLTVEQTYGVLLELELLGQVRRQPSSGEAPEKWALGRAQ